MTFRSGGLKGVNIALYLGGVKELSCGTFRLRFRKRNIVVCSGGLKEPPCGTFRLGFLQVLRKYRGIFGIFDKADVCGSLAGIKPERTEYR